MICTASFDFGTAHNGDSLVYGQEILHISTISVPPEFASTKKRTLRLKTIRSRKHKKTRELWFWSQIDELGLPVLKTFDKKNGFISIDKRLHSEFGKKGDPTIYASCALRVMILEGRIEELEDWQISKAMYSLLKRRGYDSDIPWKNSENYEEDDKEEEEVVEGALRLFDENLANLGLAKKRQLPSYLEAIKLKVLNPKTLKIVSHQTHESEPFKYSLKGLNKANLKIESAYFTPRAQRLLEARVILTEIAKRYPQLDPLKMMFGRHRIPYASYAKNLPRGRDRDLEGIFGIKIPRFDNKSLSKCLLMPERYTTGKNHPLFRKYVYLTQIRNLRVIDQNENERPLTHPEYKSFQEYAKKFWHKKATKSYLPYKLTVKQINGILSKLGLKPTENIQAIEPASGKGKAAFCKPALSYVVAFYELGKSPEEAYQYFIEQNCHRKSNVSIERNACVKSGLTLDDFSWLSKQADRTWETFYVTPTDTVEVTDDHQLNHSKIFDIIASERNPIVRNRLEYFYGRLKALNRIAATKIGKKQAIDRVAIEMCRESFSSKKKKKRYEMASKENRKENEHAKDDYQKAFPKRKRMASVHSEIQKLRLLKKQHMLDVYTGKKYKLRDLDSLQIDHIVPTSRGGNDSQINKVVTNEHFNNHEKNNLTPYEYFKTQQKRHLDSFRERVRKSNLHPKTKKLLVSPTACEDLERFTDLSLTSIIAKKVQKIIYLFFGWIPPEQEGKKRVHFVGGQFVAKIRKNADLNRLLYPEKSDQEKQPKTEEDAIKLKKAKDKKNREDNRNHAIDALIIGQCPDLERVRFSKQYQQAMKFLRDPETHELLKKKVIPVTKEKLKPVLEENFYGIKGQYYFKNHPIVGLGIKDKTGFEYVTFKKKITNILVSTGNGNWQKLGDLTPIKKNEPIAIPKKLRIEPHIKRLVYWYNRHLKQGTKESDDLSGMWARFCERMPQKKIACWEGDVSDAQFKRLKNPHGAQFGVKGKASHKFQAVAINQERNGLNVYPHYVFESREDFEQRCPRERLELSPGDLVRVVSKKGGDPNKLWILKSIMGGSQLKLENPLNPYEVKSPTLPTIRGIVKVNTSELSYPPYP